MANPLLPGAEPLSIPGGPDGVLVLHGFTGHPGSMRGLALAFAKAGFTVELPLLPGHGTCIEDMVPTRWADWSAAAERSYLDLASRCRRVVVAGLSMGGTLTCWLAVRHPAIAGIVCINPAVEPAADAYLELLRTAVAQGVVCSPGIGGDVAEPQQQERGYDGAPLEAAISLYEAVGELAPSLPGIRCPLLVITSRVDHVVPPSASDFLAASVSGPVERVFLERSFHVATLDCERDEVEARSVRFALQVGAGVPAPEFRRPA